MYSPKIREDLIPYLYKLAKFLRIPMTKLVDTILEEVIDSMKQKGCFAIFHDIEVERESEKHLAEYFQDILNSKEVPHGRIYDSQRR